MEDLLDIIKEGKNKDLSPKLTKEAESAIQKGKPYIEPTKHDAWAQYVKECYLVHELYKGKDVDAAIGIMEHIERGVPFAVAQARIIPGMKYEIVDIVATFSRQGAEFKKFMDSKRLKKPVMQKERPTDTLIK